MRSTLTKGVLATLGASVALTMAFTGTASADPNQPGFGDVTLADVVGVGSDTSQFVIDSAADAKTGTPRLVSYDATAPATNAAPTIDIGSANLATRPNGSSAGITALLNNTNYANGLDFARSSRPGRAGEESLTFVPVLLDGLSYVFDEGSSVPANLTTAQLRTIYTSDNCGGFQPLLPQAGSGTRGFFLETLGVVDQPKSVNPNGYSACVNATVQEHDPAPVNNNDLALAPFSTARYAVNPPNPSNPPRNVISIANTSTPTNGSFYVERDIFNVVRDTDVNNASIEAVFAPTGYLCNRYAASSANRQGFRVNPSCGSGI